MLSKLPPPPSTPPLSVLLLLAVGDLQSDANGEPVEYTDLITAEMGLAVLEPPPLVAWGVERGYLLKDDKGVSRIAKGWEWYEWHLRQAGLRERAFSLVSVFPRYELQYKYAAAWICKPYKTPISYVVN